MDLKHLFFVKETGDSEPDPRRPDDDEKPPIPPTLPPSGDGRK